MSTDFMLLAVIFLGAGVLSVPIASRLGLGSVLGYLLAGVAISPLLAALNVDVEAIQHFAEFGVVMMLFLVGLELEPKMLWEMRARLLGLGGLQVAGTALAVMGIAMLLGQPWTIALAIGLVLSLSSTAIVLQTLNEKGLMHSDGGQSSFSVLLFQDIAVIPMLALIPLLAMPELAEVATQAADHAGEEGGYGDSLSLVDGLAGWQAALVTIAAIGAVVGGGIYLTRPVFRFIAMAELRELFVATALLFVVGIALLMTLVGLSPALGTFIAGVVLANSEYRHELESDINPFRGLLLGLFFITIGAAINFDLLFDNLGVILGMTFGLVLLKAAILLVLASIFKLRGADRWLFGLSLAQAGEFGFVLLSFTVANYVLPQEIADRLLLVVALTMMLTPLLFILYERVILPRFTQSEDREADEIHEQGQVIIAGIGRFGGVVNRMMLSAGYETTVLDHSAAQLDVLRSYNIRAFYGDATRPDLLVAAGIADAKILVVAIDDKEAITEMVRYATANFPNLHVIARARDRHHVYDLWHAGCRDIIRESFDSAVRTGRSAYEALGMHPFEAEQMAQAYVKDDKAILREMADLYDPTIPHSENHSYRARILELNAEREENLRQRGFGMMFHPDREWARPPAGKDKPEEA
ncbi:cation:proton antiporter [Paracoccaceae bacterium GXU_MW_L88]